jgi:NAD(P)-dependent dehydrogenase (short-subunit alcohol dehydrogenase family)
MTALVTGASGGLGRAIAAALAEHGHDVVLHWRSDRAGVERGAALVEQHGHRASLVRADLAIDDPEALDGVAATLLDEAEAAFGPLDVVVLNAASQHLTPWDELDTATWDRVMAAGLRQSAALLRAAGARLAAGGAIATIGSIEGLRPARGHAAYAVSKAALHHLTAAAAAELGPRGIRVVGVAPGLIDREGLAADWPDGVSRWSAAAPLGRPVTADEVAATVAFLVSGVASGITGTTLVVDAGWSAGPAW